MLPPIHTTRNKLVGWICKTEIKHGSRIVFLFTHIATRFDKTAIQTSQPHVISKNQYFCYKQPYDCSIVS